MPTPTHASHPPYTCTRAAQNSGNISGNNLNYTFPPQYQSNPEKSRYHRECSASQNRNPGKTAMPPTTFFLLATSPTTPARILATPALPTRHLSRRTSLPSVHAEDATSGSMLALPNPQRADATAVVNVQAEQDALESDECGVEESQSGSARSATRWAKNTPFPQSTREVVVQRHKFISNRLAREGHTLTMRLWGEQPTRPYYASVWLKATIALQPTMTEHLPET